MSFTISPNAKKAVDIILALVGLTVTELVQNAAQFPAPWGTVIGVAGAPIGYLISDILTIVDTGTLPSSAVVGQQASVSWNAIKPAVQAEVSKITNPSEQAVVNSLLAVIDTEIAKVSATKTS